MSNYDGRFDAANARRKTDKHIKDVSADIQRQIDDAKDLEEIKVAMKRVVRSLRLLTQ